ncbi:hypothetical protein ACHWQZ_G002436 [Mnemiopsis leidyi]
MAALLTLTFSLASVLFYNDLIGELPFQRAIIVFSVLFPAATASSRSLNTVLTVVKTVGIISITRVPASSGMRIRSVVTSFFFSILWLALTTSDVVLNWQIGVVKTPASWRDRGILNTLFTSSLVGRETLGHFAIQMYRLATGHELDPGGSQSMIVVIDIVVITINYLIPTVLALVGMILQARAIRSTLQPNSNSNVPSTSYINRTIFLVTLLFCSSNSLYCVSFFATYVVTPGNQYLWKRSRSANKRYLALMSLSEITLPLLNAAVFPLIIILRKREYRENYTNCFRNVVYFLGGVVCERSGVVCERSGVVCERSGVVCKRSGVVCERSGVVCERSGVDVVDAESFENLSS